MTCRRISWTFSLLITALLWAAPAAAQNHKPHPAYRCSGQTDKVLSGVHIETGGIAIRVSGNCTLIIKNSFIRGGAKAIHVSGNGTLHIKTSTVVSSRIAVHTSGNGTTNAKKTTFFGRSAVSGNGDFNNNGGNKFRKPGAFKGPTARPPAAESPPPAAPPAAGPVGYKKHAPVRCIGAGHRVLKKRFIHTRGNAISTMGSCKVTLIDCHLDAGKNGIIARGSSLIVIRNSTIKGGSAAIRIIGSGTVKARGSRIFGGVKTVGSSRFVNQGGNTIK